MKIAPTLIIGLGGTGADIIAKVATKVNEGAQGQANRIQYVVFDTDTNGIQSIRTQFPQIEIVQTSTTDTVGEYLDQYSYARDNWFPINTTLNTKNLSEGAGQIRSISRLGFDTTLSAGNLKPLHNAIRRLFEIEANQEQQALKIIIVSSLAGGTGSGLILPVALYLRNYLKQNYRGSSNICRGFFIQPDIFYSVIPAAREQNTLGCNAYATVRELDAFIMKAEDTLPDKFKLLSLEFPSAGAGGRSEINVLPYDFCFLFDETNMNGGELSSSLESYKDHAATCIYAQSIGPMSKRSNSSEDNTRRDLTEAGGRNRYAGAGASRIYYPWEHIRDLVARQWAAECVSSQWLTFDHDFKRSQKQNRELLETEGIKAPDLILAKEYVRIVDERALNRDPFALAIKNQTQSLDEDGLKVEYTRFEEYVEHLKNFAKTRAENLLDSSETDILKVRIEELRKSSDYELYANNYRDLQIYHEKVIRATEENARQIAFQIFNSDEGEDVTAAKNSHKLETYMRDTTNNHYLLPNSIRYFLYNVENLIKDAKRNVDNEKKELEDFFESFEERAFPVRKNSDQKPSIETLASSKASTISRILKRPDAQQNALIDSFTGYLQKAGELRKLSVLSEVYQQTLKHVDALNKSFEAFFNALDNQLKGLKRKIDQSYTAYENLKGSTTKYVLSSRECLEKITEYMPYTGAIYSLDPELNKQIYREIDKIARSKPTEKKLPDYSYSSIFTDQILGFFKELVEEVHGEEIKIDIIDALKKEYELTSNDSSLVGAENYVLREIEDAKKMASPFIGVPIGEQKHPIEACSYNPNLKHVNDFRLEKLINEQLMSYGGVEDEDLSVYEILFYQAIYGIRANELVKFRGKDPKALDRKESGPYYKAYFELIANLAPDPRRSKVITPHLDRSWHDVNVLPDIDENNERKQIYEINKAFLFGLVFEYIRYRKIGENSLFRQFTKNSTGTNFITHNGTPCDKIYELVQALSFSKIATNEIQAEVEREIQLYRDDNPIGDFSSSAYSNRIQKFELKSLNDEFPGLTIAQGNWTVFDLALYSAISKPASQFYQEDLKNQTLDFIYAISEYINGITDEDGFESQRNNWLRKEIDQFFAQNSRIYLEYGNRQNIGLKQHIETIYSVINHFITQDLGNLALKEWLEKYEAIFKSDLKFPA